MWGTLALETDHPVRMYSAPRTAIARAARLFLPLLLPALLHAQAVTGFGDDATVPPSGRIRLTVTNEWTRFDQRFTAPSNASIDTHSQIRRTPIQLEVGLLGRFSLGVMVPSVGTKVTATYFPDTAGAVHADSTVQYGLSAIGDAEFTARIVWLRTLPDSERYAPRGFHVRSAVTGTFRLGTGSLPRPTQQFGIATGDKQHDIEVASQWDVLMGRRFWTSLVGRYGHQRPDTREVRSATPGDPFSPGGPALAHRTLGNYYQLEATPRLVLGPYVSFGAQYVYYHKSADQYTAAATPPSGVPDPSVLDARSEAREQRFSVGVVYSTVASHARGHALFPLEVFFRRTQVLSTINDAPKPTTWAIGMRVMARL